MLLDELLPKITAPKTDHEFMEVANTYKEVALEIGFGNGEHTAQYALNNPEKCLIGCEPFLNGVASLLSKIEDNNITNIRIFADDVNILLDEAPENYFDSVFIICPDPWPKKKHHKRRIVNDAFIKKLANKIKHGGSIVIATDHAEYAEAIFDVLKQLTLGFNFAPKALDECKKLPDNWIYTKYQRRGMNLGEEIYHFRIIKV